ncbi:MAG TPA: type VI secretion system baseplate subunit TssE [Fimbriiglobus sp.]|nr:type VI secretion system baseplate subunit TssE [Fimbriiglobus sp.]
MPPANQSPRLLPSLLDRLTDPESMGGLVAGYDPREMLDAVRADLEELLNTRRTAVDVPPEFEQVRRSIVTYGLPDLAGFNATAPEQSAELARVIAEVVARHEPRLVKVKVTAARGEAGARSIKFHIEAALNLDPAPEVGFETVLELTSGRATVTPDGGAT